MIGKNGAGKSTLLKILSRITPPTSGSVEIEGHVGSLLEVGTGFHPELTGLENVYLNGTILGMSHQAIRRRLDEIVDFAEVHQFMDTPVKRYSSGMRVRLAFAVAAHLDPEILIVDEVLSVGDAGFQAKCLAKMKSVAADDGRTIIYVTHNLVTLEHFCPRCVLLEGGHKVFDGPTPEAVSLYMASFPHGRQGEIAGLYDLRTADRAGTTYQQVYSSLGIHPEGAGLGENVRMGDRLRLEIGVDGLADIPEPLFLVTIHSASEQTLFRVSSGMVPIPALHPRTRSERVVIDFPTLPLTPGEYSIELQLKDHARTVDYIRRAGTFNVVPANMLGTGYHYHMDDGHVVVPWEWEVRPETSAESTAAAE